MISRNIKVLWGAGNLRVLQRIRLPVEVTLEFMQCRTYFELGA